MVITLAILRHNLSQALVAELWGISQPTVSRIYQTLRRPAGPQGLA
jgi:predicted XRE-type DNA-binding protein